MLTSPPPQSVRISFPNYIQCISVKQGSNMSLAKPVKHQSQCLLLANRQALSKVRCCA